MGDSASNTRTTKTRSGGAARPPATPAARRRKKSLPSTAVSISKSRARSGGGARPPSTPAGESPNQIDDEESPSKRQRRSSTRRRTKSGSKKKQPVARNLLSDGTAEMEVCQTNPALEKGSDQTSSGNLLQKSWIELHARHHGISVPGAMSDSNDKDEICLICGMPDELVFCMYCPHAVCPNCIGVDLDCRNRWHCSLNGLNCTKRRQIRSKSKLDKPKEDRRSGPTVNFKVGDFVEIPASFTPGLVRSRAWAVDYDSDADREEPERHSLYYARVTVKERYSKEVEVEFLIYPDQTRINALLDNELLLITNRYIIQRAWISGKASIPILISPKEIPRDQDCFVVRSRYDLERRIRRPLLENLPPGAPSNHIVIDAHTERSTSDLSHIEKAVQSLQLSSAPDVLPCRDQERAQIERILASQLRVGGGAGGALYISGLPGTGKTATVRRVIRGLLERSELPSFDYVEINALKLQAPRYAYTELWKAISKQHCSPTKALIQLNQYYAAPRSRRRKQIIILVLDEFDYLVEPKSHNVIYNLFSFPAAKKSGLIVVGIANTLDLPERIGGRVFSRLGLQCMNFEPYTAKQIQEIILERLKEVRHFVDEHAVTLCAKSIASTSGDLRRALEVMSSALELCSGSGDRLTIIHISNARKQFDDTPAMQYIREGAAQELALLCALLQELKHSGRHEADYNAVCRRSIRLLKAHGHQDAPSTVIDRIIHEMSDRSLISLCEKRDTARPALRLSVNLEDVKFALKDTAYGDITI